MPQIVYTHSTADLDRSEVYRFDPHREITLYLQDGIDRSAELCRQEKNRYLFHKESGYRLLCPRLSSLASSQTSDIGNASPIQGKGAGLIPAGLKMFTVSVLSQ